MWIIKELLPSYGSSEESLCHWPHPPTLGRLTWSVKGENIAFAFGGTLGCVGLRAAARAPTALSLRRNLLVSCRVQIWEQMEQKPLKRHESKLKGTILNCV